MKKSTKIKQLIEYQLLLQHSFHLRSTLHIAHDRYLQFEKTIQDFEPSDALFRDDDWMKIQIQTSKELGWFSTKMLLDLPQEIKQYHFGPQQIAFCLLYAMIEKYKSIMQITPLFKDENIDKYCYENNQFIKLLKDFRNSILHPRYDNSKKQVKFLEEYNNSDKPFLSLLIKGEVLFKNFLQRIWHLGIKEQWEVTHDNTTR